MCAVEDATLLSSHDNISDLQGKLEEAEPLYIRSLAISEKVLGPDHPAFATVLNNKAGLLRQMVSC